MARNWAVFDLYSLVINARIYPQALWALRLVRISPGFALLVTLFYTFLCGTTGNFSSSYLNFLLYTLNVSINIYQVK